MCVCVHILVHAPVCLPGMVRVYDIRYYANGDKAPSSGEQSPDNSFEDSDEEEEAQEHRSYRVACLRARRLHLVALVAGMVLVARKASLARGRLWE